MRAYSPLLRLPGALGFCAAALVGRMPLSMLGIGSVLLVQDRRGSYALAGLVAAAYALGQAVVAPVVSRLVDRRGQSAVLPWALVTCAAALVAVVLTAGSDLPGWTIVASAAVGGAALPPLGACVRARWTSALRSAGREDLLGTAFALESVLDEVVFVTGPALVVALAVGVDPAAGLLVAVGLTTLGTVAFVAQRGTEPPVVPVPEAGAAAALAVPGLRTVAATMVFVGLLFGSLELAVVAFADEQGSPGAAGVLLSVFALGSGTSGLLYGARTWRWPLERRLLLALAALLASAVPVVLAPGLGVLGVAAFVAGLSISPTLIASFGLVERLVPVEARTEGFTWLNSGLSLGASAGAVSAGALVDGPGARAALALSLVGAGLALATAAARRRSLVPAQVDPVG
ncbi:MAG TPA: MFS transporter [Mycobacteriales bacterium]|nr:MFS transporter [Mycobacteriales bacterium]